MVQLPDKKLANFSGIGQRQKNCKRGFSNLDQGKKFNYLRVTIGLKYVVTKPTQTKKLGRPPAFNKCYQKISLGTDISLSSAKHLCDAQAFLSLLSEFKTS